MQINAIPGVQPFNKFLFHSCYYHQLIAGLACFGIPYESFLETSLVYADKNFNINKDFLADDHLEKSLGYKTVKCNISKKKIIKSIDRGNLVIVGVDIYYLAGRIDSYHKMHGLHFILVYGYDKRNNKFKIVDHDYLNSFIYDKKNISMANLLYANKKLRYGILGRKMTSRILYKKKHNVFNLSKSDSNKNYVLYQNRNNAIENLKKFKEIISGDKTELHDKLDIMVLYWRGMRTVYETLFYISKYNDSKEKELCLRELINGYNGLFFLFLKIKLKSNFDFVYKNQTQLLRQVDGLIKREQDFYDFWGK